MNTDKHKNRNKERFVEDFQGIIIKRKDGRVERLAPQIKKEQPKEVKK